jgi:hypothetical protein
MEMDLIFRCHLHAFGLWTTTNLENTIMPSPSKYFCFRIAAKTGMPDAVRVLLTYVAAVVDLAIWTPIFTGAAILWGWIAISKYDNPSLLWVIVPVWLAAAIPPAVWAIRATAHR